ncbi:hypothetical protein AAVH_23706 [Aphelenchoides avenae]|nr:hypothetical protein AAVH_23706 [Aphelenchus avenae]
MPTDNGTVNGVIYLPYKTSNSGMHCAYAIDNAAFSGRVGDVANYFVKYTQNHADSETMMEKFAALETSKDSVLNKVL